MPARSTFRLIAFLAVSLGLTTTGEAQRPERQGRKKPFEEFSRSAQRLKDSVAVRLAPAALPADVTSSQPESAFVVALPFAGVHDSIAVTARSQLGTRYILGAERPGKAWDCSGLVRFVMAALLIELPRTAREQAQQGAQVAKDITKLRPGDLLTFGSGSRVSHIGVYVGEGRFVHASTSQREVVESSIEKPGTWFRRNWVGVRRFLASNEVTDSVGL
ncbi:MAG: C40 family peptidase [Gemmatimonadaceae bacterium]